MTKFLIIFIIIILFLIIGMGFVFRSIGKVFRVFMPGENINTSRAYGRRRQPENKEILYDKDDVIILKGEAGKKKDKER